MTYEKSENGWMLHPIEGETGMAYMGTKDEEKVFLKKNTSPFLAALSVQGITPRLKWTKRLSNGDILSAQEWLNGRCLRREEMASPRVIQVLKHVHDSKQLTRILKKVGGQHVYPQDFLQRLYQHLDDMDEDPAVEFEPFVDRLTKKVDQLEDVTMGVCHGDMSRRNWMLSDEDRIYLVDWDNALIADPVFDIASILYHYIEPKDWATWLDRYELKEDQHLEERLEWYGIYSVLITIIKACQQDDEVRAQDCLNRLRQLT